MIFSDSVEGRAFDRLERAGSGRPPAPAARCAATVLLVGPPQHPSTEPAGRAWTARGALPTTRTRRRPDGAAVVEPAPREPGRGAPRPGVRARRRWSWPTTRHGPWTGALVRAQLAGLTMQIGDMAEAMGYARAAIPVMEALGADEDAAQLKAVLAVGAIQDGRIEEAERIFDEIEAQDVGVRHLRRRDHPALRSCRARPGRRSGRRRAAPLPRGGRRRCPSRSFPGFGAFPGYEPWVLYAEAGSRRRARPARSPERGRGHAARPAPKAPEILSGAAGFLDYPVFGSVLFALALWELARRPATRSARPSPYACSSSPTGSATTGSCPAWPGPPALRRSPSGAARRGGADPRRGRRPQDARAPRRGQGPHRGARLVGSSHILRE